MSDTPTQNPAAGTQEKELLVFQIAGEEYAFPLTEVREIINTPDITPVPSGQSFVRGVVNLRGKIVTVADLAVLLGLQPTEKPAHIIVVEKENELFGFHVDMVTGVLRVPVTQLKEVPQVLASKVHASLMDQAVVIEEPVSADGIQPKTRIILILRLGDILTSLLPVSA